MKTAYIIGGTMGVGKTTACQRLKEMLPNSVFLDGDWCWDMHPFLVTDETKAMVMDNICSLLGRFVRCSVLDNVIFCWVLHEQAILDEILARVDWNGFEVKVVSLVCSPKALYERLTKDIEGGLRSADMLEKSAARLPLYERLNTMRLDTSGLTAEQTAERLAKYGDSSTMHVFRVDDGRSV